MPPTPSAEAPTESTHVVQDVLIQQIDRSRNHRLDRPGDLDRIKQLAESIRQFGQLQAVRLYESDRQLQPDVTAPYILGCGARRCLAIEWLGWATVKAEIHPPASDESIEAARGVENLQRQDLTPIEEAIVVADLLRIGRTEAFARRHPVLQHPYDYVAAELGRSREWVRDRDYLDRLTPAVRSIALETELPAGHLRAIATVGDPVQQLRLAITAAGGPTWCVDEERSIRAGELVVSNNVAAGEQLQQWLDDVAEESHRRETLRQVQAKVEQARRSLRTAPWAHAEPVPVGKATAKQLPQALRVSDTELRPCHGCPHNSATDPDLFGSAEEDAENPRGTCAHPGCFVAKTGAADRAKQQLAAKAEKRKTKPTAERIDATRPQWLRKQTAVNTARSAWERAHPKAPEPSGREDSADESAADAGAGEPQGPTRDAWIDELYAWCDEAAITIAHGVRSLDANRRGQLTAWCLLTMIAPDAYPRLLSFGGEDLFENGQVYPLDVGEREIVDDVCQLRYARLELLLISDEQFNPAALPEGLEDYYMRLHPELLQAMATAWSIDLREMPQPPATVDDNCVDDGAITGLEPPEDEGDDIEPTETATVLEPDAPAWAQAEVRILLHLSPLGRWHYGYVWQFSAGKLGGHRDDLIASRHERRRGLAIEAAAEALRLDLEGQQPESDRDRKRIQYVVDSLERWVPQQAEDDGADGFDDPDQVNTSDLAVKALEAAAGRRAQWQDQPLHDVLAHAGASFHGLGELGASTLGELVDLLDDEGCPKKAVPGIGPKKWAKFRFAAAKWIQEKVDVAEDVPGWVSDVAINEQAGEEVKGK